MADPIPSDDGTRAMPSGSGPKPPDPTGETTLPARIGRYEVRSLLGEGAFGRVFLAFDGELERPVAIKVPKPDGFTPDMRERFVREARATAKIHHPNVCPVLDVGVERAAAGSAGRTGSSDEGAVPYIVMHYQPGTTLGAHLDKWKALPPQQAVLLAQRLALGMAAAHEKGVIHRDLKPQNILFDPAKQLVLITDFGLARIGDHATATAAGAVFGTPLYMSPEQARGETDAVGPLSDVYSLGVILYRMLVGALPFDGTVYEVLIKHNEAQPTPPSAARRGLDSRLDALVLKALAKKPGDRYPSAKAFADALGEYARAGGDSGWARAVADTKSSPAVPAVPPPAPRPAVPPIAPPPPKPAARSDRPPPAVPPPAPAVPLPPPKLVEADDGGAIRQKVLIGGVALLFLLVVGAGIVMLLSGKTQPTAAKVEPAPTPAPAPAPVPNPPTPAPNPTPKKAEPSSPFNKYDPAAERRAAEWVLAGGGELKVKPRDGGNERPVAAKGDLPPGDFTVTWFELRDNPTLRDADAATNLAGLSGPLAAAFRRCGDIGPDTARALARAPQLTAVTFTNATRVTDAALEALANHPELAAVDIQATGVTRAGVKRLVTLPKVRKLVIGGVPGVDAWLADLAPLTELTFLEVLARGPTDLTEAGLKHLKPFTNLKHLALYGRNITDDWVLKLWEINKLPLMEDLMLQEAGIDGPGLAHVGKFPTLDWVDLSESRVRDEGVAHLAAVPKMGYVVLNSTGVGDESLRSLGKCKDLKLLQLRDNKKITDKGLSHLSGCPILKTLDLTNTDITDAGARELAACKALQKVTLTGTAVTAKGAEELKKALPSCNVIHTNPKAAAAPKFDPKLLTGKWEREDTGKNRVFWEFRRDGTMIVTTTGSPPKAPRPYALDGDKLALEAIKAKKADDDGNVVYTILKLTDDELEVRGLLDRTFQYKRLR